MTVHGKVTSKVVKAAGKVFSKSKKTFSKAKKAIKQVPGSVKKKIAALKARLKEEGKDSKQIAAAVRNMLQRLSTRSKIIGAGAVGTTAGFAVGRQSKKRK